MSRPWMPLYVTDYLNDTVELEPDEHGVYLLLLMLAWRRGGAIPNDPKAIKRALESMAANMHGNRFNRLAPSILKRFFYLDENGDFRNKRLGKELETAEKFSEKQKENVKKRWSKTKENNEVADTSVIPARALQSQSQSLLSIDKSIANKETRVRRASLPMSDFDEKFWPAYPHKIGKDAARKAWASAVARASVADILEGVRRYIATKPADRPWCNPATFLNQGRWADQPAEVATNVLLFGGDPPRRDFTADEIAAAKERWRQELARQATEAAK